MIGEVVSRLFELDQDECARLLHAGIFGRISFVTDHGLELLPVNYTTVGGSILVRTAPDSLLARHAEGAAVVFETDYVNYERWHGWSVVARGVAECVNEDQLTDAERSVPEPQPWARRGEPMCLRIRWTELTGRRIGQGWSPMAELPVHRAAWQ
jgi:nitroimidazol reductase NimA-like FMN-containing flavoprotein (pyridoxamine 5'-phosphate oxidase superfamily)